MVMRLYQGYAASSNQGDEPMKPKVKCPVCNKHFTSEGYKAHKVVHDYFISADVHQSYWRKDCVYITVRHKRAGKTYQESKHFYQRTIGM